jgi:rhodanese-related sulfurtransferase
MRTTKSNEMKRIMLFVSFLVLLLNSSMGQNKEPENITCQQAFDLIKKSGNDTNFVVIDFRPEKMYDEGHIKNSIFFDVFSENFENWLSKLSRNKVYLLYCNVGHISEIALNKMKQMGFKNLYHLYEGIQEWKRQGFPTEKNK